MERAFLVLHTLAHKLQGNFMPKCVSACLRILYISSKVFPHWAHDNFPWTPEDWGLTIKSSRIWFRSKNEGYSIWGLLIIIIKISLACDFQEQYISGTVGYILTVHPSVMMRKSISGLEGLFAHGTGMRHVQVDFNMPPHFVPFWHCFSTPTAHITCSSIWVCNSSNHPLQSLVEF